MSSTRLKKIKFTVERRAKNTRRKDIYFIVLTVFFVATFVMTQILLGVYEV